MVQAKSSRTWRNSDDRSSLGTLQTLVSQPHVRGFSWTQHGTGCRSFQAGWFEVQVLVCIKGTDSMDLHQRIWAIILIPTFIIAGIDGIKSGWKILKYNEDSYNLAVRIRLWILKQFSESKKLKAYQKYLQQDKTYMKDRGFYGLVGGALYLAGSVFFIFLLFEP